MSTPGPLPPHPPDLLVDAVGESPELSRRNMRFAIALAVLVLVLFGGTFGVAFIYLHYLG
jgi:hypothetical protein